MSLRALRSAAAVAAAISIGIIASSAASADAASCMDESGNAVSWFAQLKVPWLRIPFGTQSGSSADKFELFIFEHKGWRMLCSCLRTRVMRPCRDIVTFFFHFYLLPFFFLFAAVLSFVVLDCHGTHSLALFVTRGVSL
jgi:hypothetical protein